MPLEPPDLDDRTFEDIFEELRSLIPRYTPEWTDYNEHDPGITMLHLFSYLSEIMIYRLNRVPEKNYIEFLRLIGEELKPAEPAKADLNFTLKLSDTEASTKTLTIPAGTQVTAKGEDGEEIIFETDTEVNSFAASVKQIAVYDTTGYLNETTLCQTPGTFFYAFGKDAKIGSKLYIGFDKTIPPDEVVKLRIELYTQDLPSVGAHCALDEQYLFPSVTTGWEYWDGSSFAQLSVLEDSTRGLIQSGDLQFISSSAMASLVNSPLDTDDEDIFWLRCSFIEGHYEIAPRIEAVWTNTVCVSNAVTIRDEIVDGSNNLPNQSFKLYNCPVLSGTLVLQVDEGRGFEAWTEVIDLNASESLDKHYTLKRENGTVCFGDGIHGKIPAGGYNNIKASVYRYGGGAAGNVAASEISELKSTIAEVDTVTNPEAAAGGRDEETLEEIKQRAPKELKTRNRAVTNQDFENIALGTPCIRVARAKTLELFHPDYPGSEIPGSVTVIVVPYSEDKKPYPSKNFITTVCYHLNKHRLLTTELHVMAPCYEEISIEASVITDVNSSPGNVKLEILNRLDTFLNPLKGGPAGTGWEFGRTVYYSEVFEEILKISGVARVEKVILKKNGIASMECKNVELAKNSLVYSGDHNIIVQ